MALDNFQINKQSVTQSMPGQFSVTWEIVLLDGVTELTRTTFSQDYKKGDEISRIEAGFVSDIQAFIDRYKKEQLPHYIG